MRIKNPYHEGELEIQDRVDERVQAEYTGQVIGNSILRGALDFIARQPISIWGSLDDSGNPWASILIGHPGYLSTPDERTMEVDLSTTLCMPQDPLWRNLDQRREVGVLVIDLSTRRRLRINGRLEKVRPGKLRLAVEESYPNCPKHIQRRNLRFKTPLEDAVPHAVSSGFKLTRSQRGLLAEADTFFVASAHPARGMDASHRGGSPGFVRLLDERTLRIPDYPGNSMFNTLGNLRVYPRAGLVFLDFENQSLLQLSGEARVRLDLEDVRDETGGTQRFWDFTVMKWQETELGSPLGWEFLDASPFNPKL